jgi:YbbR domain-containing protein
MITFLRSLILRDFWLKLLSLVLAGLIWLTVWFAIRNEKSPLSVFASPEPEQVFYNIPVQVLLSAADIREVKVNPSAVEVHVRGESRKLQALQPKEISARVDLTGIESARGLRKRIDIITPTGITFVQVIPDEVEVIVPPTR